MTDITQQKAGNASTHFFKESKQPAIMDPKMRYVIVVSALAMFLLGFWDDLMPLGAKRKLLGQILIASAACYAGLQIKTFKSPFEQGIYDLGQVGPIVTVLWLVVLTNLINFIDGIGSIAGGVALVLMSLLCWAGSALSFGFAVLCAASMVGALGGFLRYHTSEGNIRMGDGGAYFLGFLIGALSIVDSSEGTIVAALTAPLFVLALPILDVVFGICRRGLKGLPVLQRELARLTHRLLVFGYTPRRAVLFLYSISVILLLLGAVVCWMQGKFIPLGLGGACLVLIIAYPPYNLSREWSVVGRVLGNSFESREAIRHALILSEWLEMEAKRCDTLDTLWSEFNFLTKKHGFSIVTINLGNASRVWESEECIPSDDVERHCHQFAGNQQMSLEFVMPTKAVDSQLFHLLCDVVAEAWQKSTVTWSISHNLPIDFTPVPKRIQRSVREPDGATHVTADSTERQGRVHPPVSPDATTPNPL